MNLLNYNFLLITYKIIQELLIEKKFQDIKKCKKRL